MAPAPKAKPAGDELKLFCNDTREYVYLGPLQDWLNLRCPTKPFPVLHTLAKKGKVLKMLTQAARKTQGRILR